MCLHMGCTCSNHDHLDRKRMRRCSLSILNSLVPIKLNLYHEEGYPGLQRAAPDWSDSGFRFEAAITTRGMDLSQLWLLVQASKFTTHGSLYVAQSMSYLYKSRRFCTLTEASPCSRAKRQYLYGNPSFKQLKGLKLPSSRHCYTQPIAEKYCSIHLQWSKVSFVSKKHIKCPAGMFSDFEHKGF